MGSHTRERRVIAAVGCPHCGVPAGSPCRNQPAGRPMVHSPRLAAWRVWKEQRPVDVRVLTHDRAYTFAATSDAAYAILDRMVPASGRRTPEVRCIEVEQAPWIADLIVDLTAAGLRVE